MAKLSIKAGATSQSVNIFVQDSSSTVGNGLSAVAPAGGSLLSGVTAYYSFAGTNAAATVISLSVLAAVNSSWTSGGIVTISDSHMQGSVRLGLQMPCAFWQQRKKRSCPSIRRHKHGTRRI